MTPERQDPTEPERPPNTLPAADARDAYCERDEVPPESADERTSEGSASVDADGGLAALQAELEESRQRTLRLQAELENFRKRMHRTMEEERRYAALPLMRDLLTVADNLHRAMDAAEKHDNPAGLLEGVHMVASQLTDVLKNHDCVAIQADGARFDPHFHQAIGQVPDGSVEPGTVTHVASVGYRLHDRVVRPAQVLVSVAPPPPAEPDTEAGLEGSAEPPQPPHS